jgi:hypothetical protein
MVVQLLALLSGSVSAQAQSATAKQRIQLLQARADSLARLWDEANALANLADSLAHSDAPSRLDTLKVGSLVIVANRSPLPLQAAAERAWPVIDSMYGSRAKELEQNPYLIQAIDPDTNFTGTHPWGTLVPWDKSVKEMANLLYFYVPAPQPDKAFKDWVGATIRPSTSGLKAELEQSYVALVTAHYRVGQDCFVGSLASCRSTLALDRPIDRVKLFRTRAERQEAMSRIVFTYGESEQLAAMKPCINGDDAVCVKLIGEVDPSRLPAPVGPIARQTLVRLALRLGGREAYSRLTADSTQPMDLRLTAAAGVPLDSLLFLWQSSVIAARPKSVELPAYGPLVGMAWFLVFGMVALRSSRWRVA